MTFTENDKLKALAIVHIFETSRPFGDYAACVVLNDGAGVSYGINQFTHRSGSLAAVVETYLRNGGQVAKEVFEARLPALSRKSVAAINKLAADERFKKALRSAAVTREMRAAQNEVAFERYLQPAIRICERLGFGSPLSLAVVYDSVTHGSWEWISARVGVRPHAGDGIGFERNWITEYVRLRHRWLTEIKRLRTTNYRTKFFLDQIALGNWDLRLPMTVHGARLTEAMFEKNGGAEQAAPATVSVPGAIASGALANLDSGTSQRSDAGISTVAVFESAAEIAALAADKFDRVDGVITAVATRKDAAKSLWTTVVGTISQAAWGVFGFAIGLPTDVWIVVAVIAAALMLAFLYRQITLGRIRESNESNKLQFVGAQPRVESTRLTAGSGPTN